MLVKTLLNRTYHFKSFIYTNVRFLESAKSAQIEVEVRARKNSKAICPQCKKSCPTYDHLPIRHFDLPPIWCYAVFFVYALRRVDCRRCGIHAEWLPWTINQKSPMTTAMAAFLGAWGQKLSWQDVARQFHVGWHQVCSAVQYCVAWGMENRKLTNITAIGVDELQIGSGQTYLTLVYQIDEHCRRLLWCGMGRTKSTLRQFFHFFGKDRTAQLSFVCSDMWKAYISVFREKCPQALHILDRFHIVKNMNEAVNKTRRQEAAKLKKKGDNLLVNTRWALLKKYENLTCGQLDKLKTILRKNLKTTKAYLMKEEFQQFWQYTSPWWAEQFLNKWCNRTMRSRIEPMKKVAKTLRKHKPLILNWFRAKGAISNGIVEGLNNKANVTLRKAYGFKNKNNAQIALFHALGDLPVMPITHKFF